MINRVLSRGRAAVAAGLRPLAGGLADTIAASLQRQRRLVARGAALVALTVGFAASTAVFNATYRQQAQIDAVLSNGADVTVTTSPGTTVSPTSATAAAIAAAPGVQHVEAIQHRFAYVDADQRTVLSLGDRIFGRTFKYAICVTTQTTAVPSDDQFETAAATLKMLADPTRLRILWALLHGEHSVNELAAHVGSPASTVSQHLAKLRLAKLVRTRRHGTQVFYMAENDHLERLTTEALFHADHATGTAHAAVPTESTRAAG